MSNRRAPAATASDLAGDFAARDSFGSIGRSRFTDVVLAGRRCRRERGATTPRTQRPAWPCEASCEGGYWVVNHKSAVMGPSDSGKSTLLNIVRLLDRSTSDSVELVRWKDNLADQQPGHDKRRRRLRFTTPGQLQPGNDGAVRDPQRRIGAALRPNHPGHQRAGDRHRHANVEVVGKAVARLPRSTFTRLALTQYLCLTTLENRCWA